MGIWQKEFALSTTKLLEIVIRLTQYNSGGRIGPLVSQNSYKNMFLAGFVPRLCETYRIPLVITAIRVTFQTLLHEIFPTGHAQLLSGPTIMMTNTGTITGLLPLGQRCCSSLGACSSLSWHQWFPDEDCYCSGDADTGVYTMRKEIILQRTHSNTNSKLIRQTFGIHNALPPLGIIIIM